MPSYDKKWINTVQLPEFQPWTDEYGMTLDNDKGDVGGNGCLFTAHYVTGLVKNGITPNEKERIMQVYRNNFKFPGVLMRAPSKPDDREAHDDIVGLMSADAQLNPDPKDRSLTRAVYEAGKHNYCDGVDETDQEKLAFNKSLYGLLKVLFLGKVRWTWNNVVQNKFHASSWLQRRMEMMATMQMSLQEQVNPVYWLYWAFVMYGWAKSSKDDHQDDDILRYHMAMASQGYGFLTNYICRAVREKVVADGGLGAILGQYFDKPNHPLVNLLKDIK
jgi:hypothetical protein